MYVSKQRAQSPPSSQYQQAALPADGARAYTEADLQEAFERGRPAALAKLRNPKSSSSKSNEGSDGRRDGSSGMTTDVVVDCETETPHRGRWQPGECVGARGTVWEEPGFHLYPFNDMFYPFDPNTTSFKSLVLIPSGRAGACVCRGSAIQQEIARLFSSSHTPPSSRY